MFEPIPVPNLVRWVVKRIPIAAEQKVSEVPESQPRFILPRLQRASMLVNSPFNVFNVKEISTSLHEATDCKELLVNPVLMRCFCPSLSICLVSEIQAFKPIQPGRHGCTHSRFDPSKPDPMLKGFTRHSLKNWDRLRRHEALWPLNRLVLFLLCIAP